MSRHFCWDWSGYARHPKLKPDILTYATLSSTAHLERGAFLLPISGGVMRAGTICCESGCPEKAVYRGRCRQHSTQHERYQRHTVATKRDERQTRKRRRTVVERWREIHGDWCPGYKRGWHRATDLTAQHRHALAAHGSPNQGLTVLCRACNSRHGADVQAAMKHAHSPTPGGRG